MLRFLVGWHEVCGRWLSLEAVPTQCFIIFPQQRKLMGSSAQISSGVCRCGSQKQVPEAISARFRKVPVCAGVGSGDRFRRQVPVPEAGSGRFRKVPVCAGVGSGGRFGKVPVCGGVGSGGRFRKVPMCAAGGGKFRKVPEGSGVCWWRFRMQLSEGSGGFRCDCSWTSTGFDLTGHRIPFRSALSCVLGGARSTFQPIFQLGQPSQQLVFFFLLYLQNVVLIPAAWPGSRAKTGSSFAGYVVSKSDTKRDLGSQVSSDCCKSGGWRQPHYMQCFMLIHASRQNLQETWTVPEGSGVCWCRFRRQVPEGSGGFRGVLV